MSTGDDPGHLGICRRAILDEGNGLHAYELVDCSGAGPADAARLRQMLGLTELGALAGRRPLVIACLPDALAELVQLDPGDGHFIVRIDTDQEPAPRCAARHAEAIGALRRGGTRFAWPADLLGSPWTALAPPAFVTVDISALSGDEAASAVRHACAHGVPVLAQGVETAAHRAAALAGGARLFQGDWYAQPMLHKGQVMRATQSVMLQLVALLHREADVHEIEDLLKHDAALSFNLLRFANSAGMGYHPPVASFRAAVLLVGMQRMSRWATILLATSQSGMRALGHTAVVRGRLMELLATETLPAPQWDGAFVAGVFSLLDAMTCIPMATAVDGLGLGADVTEALLHRAGPLAPLLGLVEACEDANDEAFARHALELGLSGHQINMAHLLALAWAEDMVGS